MKNKGEKAITLIALVITIIILIILAGITINLLLGKNGIVKKAQEGKIGTEVSREKEILQMSLSGIQADNEGNLIFDENTLLKELKNYTNDVEVTKSGNKMYLVKYTDSNREYEVYSNGEIDKATEKVIDKNPGEFEGEGTETNPYLIQSIEDLVALSNKVNAGESYEGKYFNIENNLNFASRNSYVNPDRTDYGDINGNGTTDALITELTTEKGFTPIGTSRGYFKGNLDGKGNTISNLYINRNEYFIGFFGYISGDNTFKNINLKDVEIINAQDYTGGIIGCSESVTLNIDNCVISGKIESKGYAAGIIGESGWSNEIVKINACINNANITGGHAGGIMCLLDTGPKAEIKNCINNGNINCNTDYGYAAGIIAQVSYGSEPIDVLNSYNEGNINGGGNTGGIIAHSSNKKININNCYNLGNFIVNNGPYAGGIIGRCADDTIIKNSYNTGEISIKKSNGYIGGILGASMGTNGKIIECYNTGNIVCDNQNEGSGNLGGILGFTYLTTIDKSYNIGTIKGKANNKGGIIANGTSIITNSYNLGKIEIENDKNVNIGGICGDIYNSSSSIENCYNLGEIEYKGNSENVNNVYIGGICGKGDNIKNVYSIGNLINIPNGSIAGAIIGNIGQSAEKLYYLKGVYSTALGNTSTSITAEEIETLEKMKAKLNNNLATLEGWKEVNNGYPILSWQ